MKVGNVIKFHDDLFFDGAVQLGWLQKRPDLASRAASAFVFHGPKYHGSNRDNDVVEYGYRLKDTASFVDNLLESIVKGNEGNDVNPYWLVVAGYGSGKSHLALTSASLLANPLSETASNILAQLSKADPNIASSVANYQSMIGKPVLVLPLDGMANFHLGNALGRSAVQQLQMHGVSTQAIQDLSPRFQIAEQFVQRNYAIRAERFAKALPQLDASQICLRLQEHDESIYSEIDVIYEEANGRRIPVEGMESAQDLLDTLCRVYCGKDGNFSHVVILFDEFGRYLEYAADKPHLAGDSSLQQIFQGVQDNQNKVRFVGFIQYELKAYLKRFGGTDLRQLQRYVTRFDTAEKLYLSSNLETIFAHMIGKNEDVLCSIWDEYDGDEDAETAWHIMSLALPGFAQLPLWSNVESFKRIVARGCWPLHPLTVWFLTKLRDVVQSRSALTFIREVVERTADLDVISGGRLRYISVAHLVLQNMLPELIAAERETGGTTSETLQFLLTKFEGRLEVDEELVLAGVAALEKMRIGKRDEDQANSLLRQATGLPEEALRHCVESLSEIGALEWNRDLGQYELLSDGTSRAQFQQWLRQQQSTFTADAVRDFFIRQAVTSLDLSSVETDFAQANEINTPEWYFEASFTHSRLLEHSVSSAFDEWHKATGPKEAKGKLLYLYIHSEDSLDDISGKIEEFFSKNLRKFRQKKVPIWIIGIADQDGSLAEHLTRVHVFSQDLAEADTQKFHRFLPAEQERSLIALRENVQKAIRKRLYWVAGFDEVPEGRLSIVADRVFRAIYPHVIPFPFDGFATTNGGGAADVSQLIRGFVAHQVSGTWVQAQPKRLQNRVNSVLIECWKAFLSSGKLCVPQNAAVKKLFERIEQAHQRDPERSLGISYAELIYPPFGLNASSAGLLIALVLASETPPRRISLDGAVTSAADWIAAAFKRSNELDPGVLGRSRLVFLAEDATARWRAHLTRWEIESSYEGKLRMASEAEAMRKVDPIPEVLEGTYKYLSDIASEVAGKLRAMDAQLSSLERELERAERSVSVSHSIKFGAQLQNLSDELDGEVWPAQYGARCDELLSIARAQISRNVASWIPAQLCRSVAQLSDFRKLAERQVKDLEMLAFTRESKDLAKQIQGSIQRVEQLQKYSLTLAEVDDYPRQPLPTDSTPVRYIRDSITTGDRLIDAIKGTQSALTEPEIRVRIESIEKRQGCLREAIAKKRAALSDLYIAPTSEAQLRELLMQARQLQESFSGTPDESDISSAILLIERIISDIESWPSDGISAERLMHILEQQIEMQIAGISSYLDESELDPPWPVEAVYKAVVSERAERARRQSDDWIKSISSLYQSTDESDMDQCRAILMELQRAPTFLSSDGRNIVRSLQEAAEERIAVLEERFRRESVQRWMSELPSLQAIGDLGLHEVERTLQQVNSCPYELNMEESRTLQELSRALLHRQDQLGIEELFSRIKQLSIEHQVELRRLLEQLTANQKIES